MDALPFAKGLAAARLALGVGMAAAPGLAVGRWIGADANRPATQVAVRAFGAREAFLGAAGLHVAGRPGVGRRTIASFAALDLFDVGVSVASRRALPASGVVLIGAVAGVSAALHLAVSRALPEA